ncbi:MAG TPA: cell division protein FtsA [Gemmatimonadales bacterium]|nr:cell division protein FtsA [Gemmatimonadales bacterium]
MSKNERRLVAGLDLGSTKTCAVIAEIAGDLPRVPVVKILGVGVAKNTGVRRGMVRDIEETARSVTAAMRDASRMAGASVTEVTCGIAGEHVSARTSSGVVAIRGEEIAGPDVERANEVARAVALGRDLQLLHGIPQEYKVDQQGEISDPVGMTGTRLEVEMYLVTVQATAAQNLRRSVERAGFKVADIVLEPLAASHAVLTDDERELGVALAEIGGQSTGVAIFQKGKIRHLASLKFAGGFVTSDLVQGLSLTQADAERVKERFGSAYQPLVNPDEMVDLPSTPGQGARQAPRDMVAHIIHQRMDEILQLVRGELTKAGYDDPKLLPAGVVLTGGTAHLPGIVELGREVFAMPVRAGIPERGLGGLIDSVQAPRYAVPVGLAMYAARRVVQGAMSGGQGGGGGAGSLVTGPGMDKLLGPVKRWLQDFF